MSFKFQLICVLVWMIMTIVWAYAYIDENRDMPGTAMAQIMAWVSIVFSVLIAWALTADRFDAALQCLP